MHLGFEARWFELVYPGSELRLTPKYLMDDKDDASWGGVS